MDGTGAYQLTFEIPGLPPIMPNERMHWRKRSRIMKQWKFWTMLSAAGKKPPSPLKRAIIVLVRHSSVEPDPDNLVASFKPILDGLRTAGIIHDDKRVNIGAPSFLWKKAPSKEGKVTVEVKETQ